MMFTERMYTRFGRGSAGAAGVAVAIAVVVGAACGPAPETEVGVEPVNDLPNPYERIEPWAELPPGATQWGQVTGVEQGPDGNLYVMHRCFENTCAG